MTQTQTELTIQTLKDILEEVLAHKSVYRVVLFGSRARAQGDPYSDTDLLIVAETDRPFPERFKDFWELMYRIPSAVELLIYTPEEFLRLQEEGNPFIETVLETGLVVYERSDQRGAKMARPGRE